MATFTEIDTIVDNLVIDLIAALGAEQKANLGNSAVAATTPGDADAVWGSGNANLAGIGHYLLHKALVAQRRIDLITSSGIAT